MRPAKGRSDHAAVLEREALLQMDYEKKMCKTKRKEQQHNLSSYAISVLVLVLAPAVVLAPALVLI